ncbi:MAG: MFS transporter, partial [Actinomycetota bacterium]|nr:MFS transporter [Actinomycetota bacterium]
SFQPLAGRIADRHGRRRILLAGTSLASATVAAYTLADGLAPLVALRLVLGVGEALWVAGAATMVADLAPDDLLSRPQPVEARQLAAPERG